MKCQPRLLLIAGYFPPVRISSGDIRPWNLARYLTALGWDVTVLTPDISVWKEQHLDNVKATKNMLYETGIKVIYTEHSCRFLSPDRYRVSADRMTWFFGGILRVLMRALGIESWIGWLPSALKACSFLKPGDIDVILATGNPFTGFQIASMLGKRISIPFVLDYRDLWTNNPWHPNSHWWVTIQEKKLLRESKFVTVVSPLSAKALDEKYGIGNKINVITNGFDSLVLDKIVPKKFNHFAIVYAGNLIDPFLVLTPLFKALNLLQIRFQSRIKEQWKFHYFGRDHNFVKEEAMKANIIDKVVLHGHISRHELMPVIKGVNLATVIASNTEKPTLEDKGVIPAKLFELIGLQVPILSIGPRGSAVDDILSDVGTGRHFSAEETDNIAEFIADCMKGRKFLPMNTEKYSWDNLSRRFNDILMQCIMGKDLFPK